MDLLALREALTDPNEVYEAIQRFEKSYDDDMPTPWQSIFSITRVERDCRCGAVELGWSYHARMLFGANRGEVHSATHMDGCPCGRWGTESTNTARRLPNWFGLGADVAAGYLTVNQARRVLLGEPAGLPT